MHIKRLPNVKWESIEMTYTDWLSKTLIYSVSVYGWLYIFYWLTH